MAYDIAGAIWRPDTSARAMATGVITAAVFANNPGHGLLSALEDPTGKGSTRVVVTDFRTILIRTGALT